MIAQLCAFLFTTILLRLSSIGSPPHTSCFAMRRSAGISCLHVCFWSDKDGQDAALIPSKGRSHNHEY